MREALLARDFRQVVGGRLDAVIANMGRLALEQGALRAGAVQAEGAAWLARAFG
jgi:hypothetical protein